MAKCPNCKVKLPPDKFKCPDCGVFAMTDAANDDEETSAALTVKLSTVEASDYNRGKTGIIDVCLGGGLVETSTVLIAGTPGAGKSTLLLTVASNLIKSGEGFAPTLYIAAEEAPGDIRARANRLGLDQYAQDNIHMLDALGGLPNFEESVSETLAALLQATEPGLIILDSLQGLCGKDYTQQVIVCQTLKAYAKECQCPSFIINHFNKDDDFAGEMSLAHAVDVLLTLEGRADEPERILRCPVKNRFGPAPMSQKFIHTETGLIPWTPQHVTSHRNNVTAKSG